MVVIHSEITVHLLELWKSHWRRIKALDSVNNSVRNGLSITLTEKKLWLAKHDYCFVLSKSCTEIAK